MTTPATATATATAGSGGLWSFVRDLRFEAMPADVVAMAQRCLLDLVGVAASGARTPGAALVTTYVADQMRGGEARAARILFDGRHAGLAGAALAGGTIIDAIDAHDGHPLTKGHVGAAVLPALLAFVDGDAGARQRCNGHELLVALVIGYEVATRAGIALHASVPDYHCSGAWNALAAAALGARLIGLDAAQFRHALGIAEYFGPRGQILRVCGHPTMLKDGSGWGAHVGVTATLLARDGFTGAPAVTVEGEAGAEYDVGPLWADLGTRWRIREQYFKPYPVCRWAQPAIEGARALQHAHRFTAGDIAAIRIESFREAVALGAQCLQPRTTDEAQYAITYPVAAMLVFGRMGAEELADTALADPRVTRLLGATRLVEEPSFSRRFPAERFARVSVTLRDGRVLTSPDSVARGSAENALDDAEIRSKYFAYATPVLGHARAERIAGGVDALDHGGDCRALVDDLLSPAE